MKSCFTEHGWQDNIYISVDNDGIITELGETKPEGPITTIYGFVIPSFQNAHSHAFQYHMRGLCEGPYENKNQDFWSWREAMYLTANELSPEQVQQTATELYLECRAQGYTSVAEFHYLHHNPDGTPYQNRAEMGERIMQAAQNAGIALTLIPIYYEQADFDKPALPEQSRFISNTLDDYLRLLDATESCAAKYKNVRVGVGVHSLRAVNSNNIKALLEVRHKDRPIHIHIAEQLREVERCQSVLKARPVEWLMANVEVNEHYNLVHATHISEQECGAIVQSGATVVLCPTTEGNLGDGFFPFTAFHEQGGRWCIGTDSHVGISPLEELRLLDYGQRMLSHNRATFCNAQYIENGDGAVATAHLNGSRAMGFQIDQIFKIGSLLQATILDSGNQKLASVDKTKRLSCLVYAGERSMIQGTILGTDHKPH